MRNTKRPQSAVGILYSTVSLGGEVARYRAKQTIYAQGSLADTLFYIQEGGVQLIVESKRRPLTAATVGVGDLFGELCLAGVRRRRCTAVALTACSIRAIEKAKMLAELRQNTIAKALVSCLLSSIQEYQDHAVDLLTSSVEERLARVLLRLAGHDRQGGPSFVHDVPNLSDSALAAMVGATRPRVNVFMNQFRRRGFIDYEDGLHVHTSLRTVLRGF
jgi:CRP/FNR family transcriptional regulator, cyclic AMP receptor protein